MPASKGTGHEVGLSHIRGTWRGSPHDGPWPRRGYILRCVLRHHVRDLRGPLPGKAPAMSHDMVERLAVVLIVFVAAVIIVTLAVFASIGRPE